MNFKFVALIVGIELGLFGPLMLGCCEGWLVERKTTGATLGSTVQ